MFAAHRSAVHSAITYTGTNYLAPNKVLPSVEHFYLDLTTSIIHHTTYNANMVCLVFVCVFVRCLHNSHAFQLSMKYVATV